MKPERQQHLDTQYILSLENDGDLHRKVASYAESGWFDRYKEYVANHIGDIRRDLREPILAPHEYAYIYLSMWTRESVRGPMTARGLGCYLEMRNRLTLEGIDPNAMFPNLAPTPVQPTQPETLESTPIMSAKITFKTVTFINNADVTTMTEAQLIDAVKTIELEIADLEAVKTKSTKITAKIAEAQATLANVVEILDAR